MGTNGTIGGGGFHHVAVLVKDFERSVRFYADGLGFEKRYMVKLGETQIGLLDTGDGNYVELVEETGGSVSGPCVVAHIALRTTDCNVAIEAARRAGANITKEPYDVDAPSEPPLHLRVAFCEGPDGELIEFVQDR